MTREERLKFCKVCHNRKFDIKQGIICGLTDTPADFETACSSYSENSEAKLRIEQADDFAVSFRVASSGKRFANYVLDMVFLMVFGSVVGVTIGIVLAIVSPESLSELAKENKLLDYVAGFILGMLYYAILESASGRTVAKFITKTKVVNKKGEKPDLSTILVRSLCRFIPFEALSFLDSEHSGWHDKLSKTRVVEV